jgi:hypothetical protein
MGSCEGIFTVLTPAGALFPPAQYGPVATFDNETATPYGNTTATGVFTDGGAQFSGDGIVMNNHGGGSLGLYATPCADGTNYMAVLGGDTETIKYSSLRDSFGLYWGSIDTYNSLSFYDGATLIATIGGGQVSPLLAPGGQPDYFSNGYVLITGLPKFNTVLVSSASNSFEFDNVAAAAPEASTWGMMALGFAGLGYAALHRAKRKGIARAVA